jgi:hypothetical protein
MNPDISIGHVEFGNEIATFLISFKTTIFHLWLMIIPILCTQIANFQLRKRKKFDFFGCHFSHIFTLLLLLLFYVK